MGIALRDAIDNITHLHCKAEAGRSNSAFKKVLAPQAKPTTVHPRGQHCI